MSTLWKLVVLIAVLLMPLDMARATLSASPNDIHMMMVGMEQGHCPDQSKKDEHNDGLAACSLACASALPAQELAPDETPLRQRQLVIPMIAQTLRGVIPEIATPPPKPA